LYKWRWTFNGASGEDVRQHEGRTTMRTVRRDALRLLGAGVGGAVMSGGFGKAFAAPPNSYIDYYCYCSDILVSVGPEAAMNVIATGENFTKWSASNYREVGSGLWSGTSKYTGKPSVLLRFKVDPKRYLVDYHTGRAEADLETNSWGRVVPGPMLGYPQGTSIVAIYSPRGAKGQRYAGGYTKAGGDLDDFLRGRALHGSQMYKIKLIAEKGARAPANALLTGEYLATYSELVAVPVDTLLNFISDGMSFGKFAWGSEARTKVGADTFRCKSEYGGADVLVRIDVDRERKSVDYYVGEKPDAMTLHQSARIYAGPAYDYDANVSLVTFTRWRAAGQSNFDWDAALANQVQDTNQTKGLLEAAKG
jgi:hypothetical protein